MEFYEVIESRRTTRDFENASIDDAIIKRIISAAMKAPSNDHMRDWHFIVIKGKDGVFKLIDKIPKQHRMFAEASCVVIPLFKQKTDLLHPDNLSHLSGFVSIWCSIANMLLATTAEGYAATLRIPLGNEGQWARTVLNFPEEYLMPCFIAIGKPRPDAVRLKQIEHPLEQVIHKNTW